MVGAFVATHLPPPEGPPPYMISDKLLHFLGFVVLGMVSIWRITGGGVRLRARVGLLWCLGLVAYGLFDEVTQPLVGRTFEWADWIADGCGAAAGVLFAAVCSRRAPGCGS
jgi:VanZ family protein